MTDSINLENDLEMAKKYVKTDSYPMSINEIISLYEKDKIIVRPLNKEYSKWTIDKKSKLIESVFIGFPLPSFFMTQDEHGIWEVLYGIERLYTIFDFIGILKDQNKIQDSYENFHYLSDDLFYLKNFSRKGWNDFSNQIKLDFKTTKIQLIILMRKINKDEKFELFKRMDG